MNNFKHKKLISSQKHQKLENVFEKFFFSFLTENYCWKEKANSASISSSHATR